MPFVDSTQPGLASRDCSYRTLPSHLVAASGLRNHGEADSSISCGLATRPVRQSIFDFVRCFSIAGALCAASPGFAGSSDADLSNDTGASRGIGTYIAKTLAAHGVSLALSARDAAKLEDTQEACETLGARAIAVPTDVTSREDLRRLVETAGRELGPIDILVNNAGIEITKSLQDTPFDEIDAVVRTRLFGSSRWCCRRWWSAGAARSSTSRHWPRSLARRTTPSMPRPRQASLVSACPLASSLMVRA
jgi:short chain dehydrogenase